MNPGIEFLRISVFASLSLMLCIPAHAKTSTSQKVNQIIEKKLQHLRAMRAKDPIITLDIDKYNSFIKTKNKNYSMFVTFTALNPQRRCQMCRDAYGEFRKAAYSWQRSAAYEQMKDRAFFAVADFDANEAVFQQLQLNTAPVYIHFPPAGKRSRHDKHDINLKGFTADAIARWASERLEIRTFKITTPPNYQMLAVLCGVLCFFFGVLYFNRDHLDFLYGRSKWAFLILVIVFVFMSGQMWNQIRTPPFWNQDRNGKVTSYFYRSTGGQMVAETYIVFAMYAVTTVGMILMYEARFIGHYGKKVQQGAAFAGLIIYFLMVHVMIGIYTMKNNGYPYNWLFKF